MLSGSTLYGTTTSGGTSNGTVFKLNTDGTGYTVLYNFPASYYGPSPRAPLMLSGSTLYGTTYGGGSSDYGAVFKLNTDGTGYTVLKSFAYSTDGRNPQAGLTVSGGTLYGTSENGGSSGGGTVFRLNTDGTGYTVLHNFVGPTDGNAPLGGLALSGSMLYGTASEYGSSLQGTVFKLNTNGTGYTVLHGFGVYGDGMNPQQGLTLSGSTLFGTTDPHTDNGTVFKLNINGTGYSALRNLNYSDGAEPVLT
jgi:uncharacterized repeat protein (TIGR03803 family)